MQGWCGVTQQAGIGEDSVLMHDTLECAITLLHCIHQSSGSQTQVSVRIPQGAY